MGLGGEECLLKGREKCRRVNGAGCEKRRGKGKGSSRCMGGDEVRKS